ncbi:helix-turn-helix domain-containing protein [Paenibacillus sp. 1P07SE]|uniref:helix-turn-helix domain-containing protein n=1 Tax=Paenibacillus sp. 1P07SE TaxID=3132209 RepID=UPI0039A6CFD8
MEAEHAETALTEDEFADLRNRAAAGDQEAVLVILQHFEPFMRQYCTWIGMPREDAMQSMRLAVLEWLRDQRPDQYRRPDQL